MLVITKVAIQRENFDFLSDNKDYICGWKDNVIATRTSNNLAHIPVNKTLTFC